MFELMMVKAGRQPVKTLPEFSAEVLKILDDIAESMRAQAESVRANVADPLTVQQVSILTGIGVRTIHERVATGDFPKPVKCGASSRWRRADVNAWCDSLQE